MINMARLLVAFNDRQKNSKSETAYGEQAEEFYSPEEHFTDPDAHHARLHASSHAAGGEDPLDPGLIGAGRIFRLAFNGLSIIYVEHNLGAYPIVQVVQEDAFSEYGVGAYGDKNFGGAASGTVAVPLNIIHNSRYSCTIELSTIASGEVVCCG